MIEELFVMCLLVKLLALSCRVGRSAKPFSHTLQMAFDKKFVKCISMQEVMWFWTETFGRAAGKGLRDR